MTTDSRGTVIVDVAEVWAVGARSDAQVYAEMVARVQAMPNSIARRSLHSVVSEMGRKAHGVDARHPSAHPEPWLVDRLVHTAALNRRDVEAMTSQEAVDAWTAYVSRGG